MQCWTGLFPLLGGDARVHVAIVAMHIPLLGTPLYPKTSFATCYLLLVMELTIWGKMFYTRSTGLQVPAKVVGHCDEDGVQVVLMQS